MSASWYDVLGVAPDASETDIRSAWRSSIEDLDPTDRRFALYNEAAGVLLDRERRAAYDSERSPAHAPEPRPAPAPESAAEPAAGTAPEQTGTATTAPGPEERQHRRLPAVSTRLLVALAVLTALVAGGAAYLQFGRTDPGEVEASLADARQAAEASLPKVFTYDHRFPDRDRDQAARLLTGDLKDEYERLWDEAIAPNLEQTEGTASSEVLGSGAVRADEDGDRADILVVLKTVTGNANQTQQLTLALTARMVEEDGVWLIEDIEGWDPEAVTEGGQAPEEAPDEAPDEGAGGGNGQKKQQKQD